MHRHQQHVRVRIPAEQDRAEQTIAREIERPPNFGFNPFVNFQCLAIVGEIFEMDNLYGKLARGRHDDRRVAVSFDKVRAQDFMPPNNFPEGVFQSAHIQVALELDRAEQIVGRTGALQLIQKPQSSLGER
jgi:hypothetical protein